VAVYGLFGTLRRALSRRSVRGRALVHLATVLVVIGLSSLPLLAYNNWLVGAAAAEPLPQELLTAPGSMIERLGYVPYPLFVLGLVLLARSGKRTDRALLLTTVLVSAYAFLHYQFGLGNAALYSRSILYVSLLLLLIAALAAWVRTRRHCSSLWIVGAAGLATAMLPSVALNVDARYEESFYHRIGETQYDDFAWIRDNLCPGYGRALADPKFGRPFAAVSGRYAYAAIPATAAPVRPQRLDDAREALKEGVPDADWLRERGVSIVYTTGRVEARLVDATGCGAGSVCAPDVRLISWGLYSPRQSRRKPRRPCASGADGGAAWSARRALFSTLGAAGWIGILAAFG
jgi:hypothetical protein